MSWTIALAFVLAAALRPGAARSGASQSEYWLPFRMAFESILQLAPNVDYPFMIDSGNRTFTLVVTRRHVLVVKVVEDIRNSNMRITTRTMDAILAGDAMYTRSRSGAWEKIIVRSRAPSARRFTPSPRPKPSLVPLRQTPEDRKGGRVTVTFSPSDMRKMELRAQRFVLHCVYDRTTFFAERCEGNDMEGTFVFNAPQDRIVIPKAPRRVVY